MVVESSGTIHLFDFAISLHKPIKSEAIGLKSVNLLDLSKSKSNLDVVRLVVGGENNSFDLKCRRLNPSLSARKNLDKHELESLKLHILHSTIGAAHNSKISFYS